MREYIDREALLKGLSDNDPSRMEDYYYNAIANAPNADVVEVRHGHWIENEDDFWVMCSVCGTEFLDDQIGIVDTYKYCPYCGAKMDGERKKQE